MTNHINPLYVTLVQPQRHIARDIALALAMWALRALLLWWLAPIAGIWEPSFWQAFAAIMAVRAVISGSDARAFSATRYEIENGLTK